MKKTLNTANIVNELKGESSFFRRPDEQVDIPLQTVSTRINEETNERTNEATNQRSDERSNERRQIRHTFDIFADQLLRLREIVIEREKVFGKRALLGDLVQEALDMFITKERNNE